MLAETHAVHPLLRLTTSRLAAALAVALAAWNPAPASSRPGNAVGVGDSAVAAMVSVPGGPGVRGLAQSQNLHTPTVSHGAHGVVGAALRAHHGHAHHGHAHHDHEGHDHHPDHEALDFVVAFRIPGFDPVAKAGLLIGVDPEGNTRELHRRPGWSLQQVHVVEMNATPGVLLLWRSFPKPDKLSPELWAEVPPPMGMEDLAGYERVWPKDERPVVWHHAKAELRSKDGAAHLWVRRKLAGENSTAPLLGRKEVWRLTAQGPELARATQGEVTTTEQRLNLIADLVDVGAYARARSELKQLPRTPTSYFERAAVVLSHIPMGERQWAASKQALDMIVAGGGPVAERAAARLFEMVQREWEVGVR